MNVKSQGLRESASVIIAAQDNSASSPYDFSVLLCKRTEQTAYFHDHCVFPGGVYESADEDTLWLKYFEEFGIGKHQIKELINTDINRPQIFTGTKLKCPKDLALRITAIRETFEEVGLLLCCDKQNLQKFNGYGSYLSDFERKHWQGLVHSDPKKFLKLCKHLSVVPDVWSLYEWSVCRSPAIASKRYDTVFYFVALADKPNLLIEKSEVADIMWQSPSALLDAFSSHFIWLPTIQFYELSRLTHICDLEKLQRFSKERNKCGSTLLMPVYYKCIDGMIGIFPGDDLYPDNPDRYNEIVIVQTTLQELRSKTERRHRLVYRDMYDMQVDLSISPIDNHLSPVKRCYKNKL